MFDGSILLVEDEKDLNRLLSEFLKNHFRNVYSAFDGVEGLSVYNEKKPDAIITDINMPKLDGLSMIEMIRQNDDDTKIVVISAHTDKEKLFKAIGLHLVTYMVKPVATIELEQTILNIKNIISRKNIVYFDNYSYDLKNNILLDEARNEISLTKKEHKFLTLLLSKNDVCVPYYDLHNHVYDMQEFSMSSLTSLVKRLRKKLDNKDIIQSCFGEGYKISAKH